MPFVTPVRRLGAALCLLAGFLAAPRPAAAFDDPAWWNGEIARAEADADRLWDVMAKKGTFAVGTALNEVDVDVHTCHILSIFLDKQHLTPKLVAKVEHEPDSDPGFDEGVEGNSRSNWANLAKTFLAESQVERIRAWNLDCVGKFGISGRDYIREGDRRALVERDGDGIRVLGNVEKGFAEELEAAVAANPGVTRILLGSAGGNVGEAVKAGRFIREKKLDTELYNNCESACSLVFLGGVERRIWSPYPTLGFHRISSGGKAIADRSEVYDKVRAYADELGADGARVVGFMKKAGVKSMHRPEMDALCAANVATAVQRVCFGEPPQASAATGAGDETAAAAANGGEAAPVTTDPSGATESPVAGALANGTVDPADSLVSNSQHRQACADMRAQRQRLAEADPNIARSLAAGGTSADTDGIVAIFDAMLRDHGC
ncbi:hypothetical protein [Jiella sonneratiae]|uniref:Uncharacterized protein n=1 Tax=Jiella sonneratiae TaxID=2816856 RepID=A0ABS3J906_9HYPH|nr:hypothetical protein [Jiella sonneratiae]MBO0905408.1 hypothetical protein [Jiella sonneratiae]